MRQQHIGLELERQISDEDEEEEEEKGQYEYETEEEESVDEMDPGYQQMIMQKESEEKKLIKLEGGMKGRGNNQRGLDSPFGSINGDDNEGIKDFTKSGPVNEKSPLFQYEDVESNR